jgi:uncharacterized protein YuzE
MKWHVSDEDVGYLQFGESRPSAIQKIIQLPRGTLVIDLDRDSRIIGFEFLSVSSLLPEEERDDRARTQGC